MRPMTGDERQSERLTMPEPVDGWFGDFAVRIVDVSATGAQFEADEAIPLDAQALLRFYWHGEEIEVRGETKSSGVSRYAIAFVENSEVLQNLIAAAAAELTRAQEANARGERDQNLIGDQTLTAASRGLATGYTCWRFSGGQWTARPSLLCDQPPDGFTVSNAEPADQVELLCHTYESGDDEARRMTRLLAEMSVGREP